MISHITKIEERKKKGYMVIKIFLLIEFFYSMGTQENKNLHVKLPNVATWLKWSEFFTCWEIRPVYYIWLYDLRNQKLISFSLLFFNVFQLKFILFYFIFSLIVKFMRLLLCANITGIFPTMVEWTERGDPKYSQEACQLWSAGVNVMW